MSQWRARLRRKVIEKLGGKCARCGFADYRALQIDHVNGGGGHELHHLDRTTYLKKVLADTDHTYQCLCANCNWIKRAERKETKRNWPSCICHMRAGHPPFIPQ